MGTPIPHHQRHQGFPDSPLTVPRTSPVSLSPNLGFVHHLTWIPGDNGGSSIRGEGAWRRSAENSGPGAEELFHLLPLLVLITL